MAISFRYGRTLVDKIDGRGISLDEVGQTLETGQDVSAHSERLAKVAVFPFNAYRNGRLFEEKEVRVIYQAEPDGSLFVFTAIARYGRFT